MNLFWIIGAWMLVAGLTSVLLLAAGVHFFGDDPLRMLDGRKLASVLDDRDRAHMLDAAEAHTAAYEYAEREAMEWDYVLSLPSREPSA